MKGIVLYTSTANLAGIRTAIIAALYKMYFLGMPPQEAKQYLRQAGYGFKYGWLRSGLTRYLKNHPSRPPDLLLDTAAISIPQPSAAQF